MGSSNSDAPTVKQSLSISNDTISLDYTSITWASGDSMKSIMDKDSGARMRSRVNRSAPRSPLATFKSSIDFKCGNLSLAAGEYKVYYTISDACEWQINFAMKDKVQTMKLPLMESPTENKRLLMCLYAEGKGPGAYIAFGNQMCTLSFAPAKKS